MVSLTQRHATGFVTPVSLTPVSLTELDLPEAPLDLPGTQQGTEVSIDLQGEQQDAAVGDEFIKPVVENVEEGMKDEAKPILRRSVRERKATRKFTYSRMGIPDMGAEALEAFADLMEAAEPITYRAALESPNRELWRGAIDDELESLRVNHTWTLEKLPSGKNLVGCKWIFKLKTLPNGSTKHKARLVAKGYSQIEGVDFDETYAPVVKFQSLRMLLAIANELDMHVHQMDVKTAYLHGELEQEIYMKQPEGAKDAGNPSLVCKLKKSLYGL